MDIPGISERGRVADRYELVRCLGRGGLGTVFLGRDMCLGSEEVVVKVLPALLGYEERVARRIRREISIVRSIRSHRIVQLYEFGVTADRSSMFLVSEFVPGGDLRRLSGDSSVDPILLRELWYSICYGVAIAHRRQIVHRNLKPSNILLADSGEPKIADFGLATLVDTEYTHTRTAEMVGTPQYMSPEQLKGAAPSTASDVYALGMIAYELATGSSPFSSTDFYAMALEQMGRELSPAKLDECSVPGDLGSLILRCLRRDPRERPSSACSLCELIRPSRRAVPARRAPAILPPIRRRDINYFIRNRAGRLLVRGGAALLLLHLFVTHVHSRTAGATAAALFVVEKALGVSLRPVIRLYGMDSSYFAPETAFGLIDRADFDSGTRLMLRTLQSLGALSEVRNQNGDTPLLHAVRTCSTSSINSLSETGADWTARDVFGDTPMLVAIKGNCSGAYNLAGFTPLDVRDAEGDTLFHLAAAAGLQEALSMLLEELARPRNAPARQVLWEKDRFGTTVLHQMVAGTTRPEIGMAIVQYLRQGPDINAVDKVGRTAAMYALDLRRDGTALLLLNLQFDKSLALGRNATIDLAQRDARGRTTLMYLAAAEGRIRDAGLRETYFQTFARIADQVADVNLADDIGRTALWYAAAGDAPESIALLFHAGAACAADRFGMTPQDVALNNHATNALFALDVYAGETKGCNPFRHSGILRAALTGQVELVSSGMDRSAATIECWPLGGPNCVEMGRRHEP